MRLEASSSKLRNWSPGGCCRGADSKKLVNDPNHITYSFRIELLTLLRRPTKHTWKRRTIPPHALHARILVLPAFQPGDAVGVFRLDLRDPRHVALQTPVVGGGGGLAIRSERLALRVHRKEEPSEKIVRRVTTSTPVLGAAVSLIVFAVSQVPLFSFLPDRGDGVRREGQVCPLTPRLLYF